MGEMLHALEKISSQGISECSIETYYKDEVSPESVDPITGSKGLGCFGEVTLATTLWNRCVLGDLFDQYSP